MNNRILTNFMHHLNMGSIAVEVLRETKEDIEIMWITIFWHHEYIYIFLVDLKILSLFNLIESIQYII